MQLYMAPIRMTQPTGYVIIGTILYQSIVTMTPTVATAIIQTDISEVIRMIVSNGMILYALTRDMKGEGSR